MADDIDMLAGEYVLGTLEDAERKIFQRRLLTDPQAVAAVTAWQDRLAPLLLTVHDARPPTGLWPRIERMARPANDNRTVRRWQVATAAAALVAIFSSGLALRPHQVTIAAPIERPPVQSIAALSEAGGAPALLVTYDPVSKKMQVVPVNVASRPGHSMELWVITGAGTPKSIGLMRDRGATSMDSLTLDLAQDMTIAVSVEPKGGSPTGLPTGPVVYSGRMLSLPTS